MSVPPQRGSGQVSGRNGLHHAAQRGHIVTVKAYARWRSAAEPLLAARQIGNSGVVYAPLGRWLPGHGWSVRTALQSFIWQWQAAATSSEFDQKEHLHVLRHVSFGRLLGQPGCVLLPHGRHPITARTR